MGIRDWFGRPAIEPRHETRIEFLGEQDGPAEQDLRSALRRDLANFPEAARAYLARVGYQPATKTVVAL